jgi:hypothetical protein
MMPFRVKWRNIVLPDRAQMTMRCMRFACWITKATDKVRICNTYCFPTAKVIGWTRRNMTYYIYRLSWLGCNILQNGNLKTPWRSVMSPLSSFAEACGLHLQCMTVSLLNNEAICFFEISYFCPTKQRRTSREVISSLTAVSQTCHVGHWSLYYTYQEAERKMGYRQNTYIQSRLTCYTFNDVNIVESCSVVLPLDILGTLWMYGQGSEVYLSTCFGIYSCKPKVWRSRWPCGLRGRAWASRLLWIRFRNSLRAWMFVFVVHCVGSGPCDGLITCSEES